ncbi:conserved protein of unknown function [Burkholderia multivorans]
MATQFGRKVSLIIGQDAGAALDLSGLRIVFRVQRGDTQTPNSLRARIYNVSDNTAQRAESKEFTRIVLQAGYEGNYGIIFDGSIVQPRRGRESPTDTFLDITAADGDMAYNFAVVNTTLAAGSTPQDHVKVCAAAMYQHGVTPGYAPWGSPAQAKPTAADIAAQQAKVDAARKVLDDKQNQQLALIKNVDDLMRKASDLRASGDEAGAIAALHQAQDSLKQVDQIGAEVNAVYLPAWQKEVAKLNELKAAASAPDSAVIQQQALPRGKVMFGMARDYLETVARSTQTLWSIQDGQLQIVPETSYVPGDIPLINAKTGMVGMPEQTQNGIKVRMLLNPSVKIGRLIKLDNASIQRYEFSLSNTDQAANYNTAQQNRINGDGYYYVMSSEIWGDTRGNDWYTEVICLAVDATILDVNLWNKSQQGISGVVPPKLDIINPYG